MRYKWSIIRNKSSCLARNALSGERERESANSHSMTNHLDHKGDFLLVTPKATFHISSIQVFVISYIIMMKLYKCMRCIKQQEPSCHIIHFKVPWIRKPSHFQRNTFNGFMQIFCSRKAIIQDLLIFSATFIFYISFTDNLLVSRTGGPVESQISINTGQSSLGS